MAFNKKTWKDRVAEYINRRLLTKEDGSTELVTVARNEGTISVEGDAFNAETMNDLEDRVESAVNELTTNVNKKQNASTAITTSNIGSQSVSYAITAGSANAVVWSKVTGKPSTYAPATHQHNNEVLNPAALEMMGKTPYIDFHYNNSSADFTSRLVDFGSGGFHYYSQNGEHYFKNTSNGNQTACVKSNGTFGAGAGGTAIVGSEIYMQYNWAGGSFAPVYGASFTNPSSRLVKENVSDMSEEEAKKVLLLNPIEFDYIKEFGGEKDQRGLIAEDALDIIPSCVTVPDGYSEKDFDASKGIKNKVLAIDYSKLVPYLIKMVQIQQEEIEKIKEQCIGEGGN